MRYFITLLLCSCVCLTTYSKSVDTTKLYFGLGITSLNPAAKNTIDSLVYNDILLPGKKLGIVGYADFIGSDTLNVRISEDRAKNVQTYLTSMGIRPEDIQVVIGRGEVKRADTLVKGGYQQDRRVDIIPGGIKGWKPSAAKAAAKTIDISQLKKNEAIRLNKIFFIGGRHTVTDASKPELDNLYTVMKDNPTLKIRIEGHICCFTQGTTDGYDYDSEDFNLSENRAHAIYDYLASKGIDKTRMEYKGFGKTRPLVDPEKTEADEDMNRRVEIRVLAK